MLFSGIFQSNILKKINSEHGIVISILNQSDIFTSDDELIDIPPGCSVKISIKRQFINKKPKPFSECIGGLDKPDSFDSDLYREVFKIYKTYNQRLCIDMCLQKYIVENTGCYIKFYPNYNNSLPCNSEKNIKEALELRYFFYNEKENEKCYQHCPFKCDTQKFILSSTNKCNFLTDEQSNIIKYNPSKKFINYTVQDIKENFVEIKVYYPKLEYTRIDEFAKITELDLISNIGGTMGLFLGMSFLSLIEIVEFLTKEILKKSNKII